MLRVKTYNANERETGLVECESLDYFDRDLLICIDVKQVGGAIDIIDYLHFCSCTHIVIPAGDLVQAKAA